MTLLLRMIDVICFVAVGMADCAICSVSSWLAARSCGVVCTQCIAWRRSYLFQVIVWPCLCFWCTSPAAAVMLHYHDLSQLFVSCGYTAALVEFLKRYAHTALLLHCLMADPLQWQLRQILHSVYQPMLESVWLWRKCMFSLSACIHAVYSVHLSKLQKNANRNVCSV